MKSLLAISILAITLKYGCGLDCLSCDYSWSQEVDDVDGPVDERITGNPKCATGPSDSEKGITKDTCAPLQTCATIHLKFTEDVSATSKLSAVQVSRGCVVIPPGNTESCYNKDNFPDSIPVDIPDEVTVDNDSEICQCDSETCNNKSYKAAAGSIHMGTLWIMMLSVLAAVHLL